MSEEGPEPQENTSGQGADAVLPEELQGLNWGGFFLNFIWGIGNRVWITLIALIPVANVIISFMLLFKGNQWAWEKKRWNGIDHFRRVQRLWGWVGLVAFVALAGGGGGYFYYTLAKVKGTEPYRMAFAGARANTALKWEIGTPMDAGLLVAGKVRADGADLSFMVFGPRGKGRLYSKTVRDGGAWRLESLAFRNLAKDHNVDLLYRPPSSAMYARLAAKPAHRAAAEALGKGDYARALKAIRPMANDKDALAQFRLAQMFQFGTGVPENEGQAVKWYRRAADQGLAEAQYYLALANAEGRGTLRNLTQAVKWHRRAAQQGFAPAHYRLGTIYETGRLVAKDQVIAHRLYSAAAGKGFEEAKIALDRLEKALTPEQVAAARRAERPGTPVIPVSAQPIAVAAQPNKTALEIIDAELDGPDRDAAVWDLRMLALQGGRDAQMMLGDLHMRGRGVVKNYSLAGLWYERAAKRNDAEAQFKLAELYEKGLGVPFSLDMARKWLTDSARLGYGPARERLEAYGVEPPPVDVKAPPEAEKARKPDAAREKRQRKERNAKLAALGPEIARAAADGEAPADLLVVEVLGLAATRPAGEDAALKALVDGYVAAVNAKDLDALKGLMVPEFGACRKTIAAAAYDAYLERGLGYVLTRDFDVRIGSVGPQAALPFQDFLHYPVRPTHVVRIEPKGPPRPFEGGTLTFNTSAIVHALNRDGAWSLVLGCPTVAGLERLNRAGKAPPPAPDKAKG